MKKSFQIILVGILLGCFACHRHESSEDPGHSHPHTHAAPHGGVLTVLGNDMHNLEWVHDSAAGRLDLYIFDAHVENFLRVAQGSVTVDLAFQGQSQQLQLLPVESRATGESPGNAAHFNVTHSWLKEKSFFTGLLKELQIQSTKYEQIPFKVGVEKSLK